jgi:hypothetical protein
MAASLYKNIEIKFILTKTGKIQAELLLVA